MAFVRDGQILLKDIGGPMSTTPLSSKWQMLIKYISCEGYSEREVQRFQEAFDLISKHSAQRDLDGYNRLRHRYKSHKSQFLSWMLFDFYDMMPTNRIHVTPNVTPLIFILLPRNTPKEMTSAYNITVCATPPPVVNRSINQFIPCCFFGVQIYGFFSAFTFFTVKFSTYS